jgi:hypothetical protein
MKTIVFFLALLMSGSVSAQSYEAQIRQQHLDNWRADMLRAQEMQAYQQRQQTYLLEQRQWETRQRGRSPADIMADWPRQQLLIDRMRLENEMLRQQLERQ